MTELVRNSLFQIQLRFGSVRIGLAVGLRGGVVAVLVVIGQVA